ncbi:MAG TPA: uracil-DNA glycosylase [Candidatus Rubrimentiphilum sp.]|nr:uracil-DNA glycosylase [Candidatus Rubrimentiphilum sp.]
MSASALRELRDEIVGCAKCPELRRYCRTIGREKKRAFADATYWAKPVPGFGDPSAQVVLVGLAPGAHGSNRTGRPFTGDASGDFLYPALFRAGFANQPSARSADDGLQLRNCFITAALRCAPPQNKPAPVQLRRCFPYLCREFAALEEMRVVVGLGAIGTKAAVDALKANGYTIDPERWQFAHGQEMFAGMNTRRIHVIASFHPSRQNTNTGKLTVPMFDAIFTRAAELLSEVPAPAKDARERSKVHPSSHRA